MEKLPVTLIILFSLFFLSCNTQECTIISGQKMTMPYKILIGKQLRSHERKKVEQIISSTFDQIHDSVNNWNPTSEVSSLSKTPNDKTMEISSIFHHLLEIVDEIYEKTDGLFDPTISPILESLRKDNENSSPIGWKKLQILPNRRVIKKADVQLDLCGISKGFCLDLLVKRLEKAGFSHFLCEWAGEIVARGNHPQKKGWDISIDGIETINIKNCAIATSGSFLPKYWEKDRKSYTHIVDPNKKTAIALEETPIRSITVMASTCALADAIATACMVPTRQEEIVTFAKKMTVQYSDLSIWIGYQCQKPSSSI